MLSQTPHGHPGREARTCSACGKMAGGLGGGTGAGSGGGLFCRSLLSSQEGEGQKGKGKEREESPRVCVKATPTSQGGPKHAVRATEDIRAPANLTI